MRLVTFDFETYNLTDDGGEPLCLHKEIEFLDLEMSVDENGNPTPSGIISYYMASAILAALVCYIFYMI